AQLVPQQQQQIDYTKVNWISQPLQPGQNDPYYAVAPDQSPSRQLPQIIKHYGPPDIFDASKFGLAVWKRDTLKKRGFCIERIIISDYPTNFIETWVYFPLPYARGDDVTTKLLADYMALDPSLGYDSIKQMIFNDATRIDNAIVYIVVALRLLIGKINLAEARQLLPMILNTVNPVSPSYNIQASQLYEMEICQ